MNALIRPVACAFFAGATALLFSGCTSCSETTYRDVKRAPVVFESEHAGQTFYAALARMPYLAASEEKSRVTIPVVFHYTRTVKSGDDEKFNEAVRRCDTNKDGHITDVEANIFASQYH